MLMHSLLSRNQLGTAPAYSQHDSNNDETEVGYLVAGVLPASVILNKVDS